MKYIKTNTLAILPLVVSTLGSFLIILGPLLPWFTFLGGIKTFSGIAGLNGQILLGSGILTLVLSIFWPIKKVGTLHWVLGLVGFLQFAFCGFLLLNLYKTLSQLSTGSMNSMVDAGIGPGLFVTTAGSVLLFSILFMPITKRKKVNTSLATL